MNKTNAKSTTVAPLPDQMPTVPALPQEVQDHILFMHNATTTVNTLRRENQELRTQIEVETRINERLTRELRQTRERCDFYQAYSTEIRTHLSVIRDGINQAHDKSLQMAHDTQTEPLMQAVENAADEMVNSINTNANVSTICQDCESEARAA